jgi:hypothetical protein
MTIASRPARGGGTARKSPLRLTSDPLPAIGAKAAFRPPVAEQQAWCTPADRHRCQLGTGTGTAPAR